MSPSQPVNQQPLVTIGMPVYNEDRFLSLYALSFSVQWELGADGSRRLTFEVAARWPSWPTV